MKIVCLYDKVAEVFGTPVFTASVGTAVRSFGDEINKTDGNQLALHPSDYELILLGDFSSETGDFELRPREVIARGADYVRPASIVGE